MTDSAKIADALIAGSRGILTKPSKPNADSLYWPPSPAPIDLHVMPIETYRARFGANSVASCDE